MIRVHISLIILFFLAIAAIVAGLCYSLYLGCWVYLDKVLTTRQKFEAYWPAYALIMGGAIVGYASIMIAQKTSEKINK